jgi:uncharacterized protein (TIGR03435 family)
MKPAIAAAGLLTLGCCLARAQTTVTPRFEVASIKPVPQASGVSLDFRVERGGRLTVTNLTLKVIILQAFGVKQYQIAGGPAWLDTDRFDIAAKAEGDPGRQQMMAMPQALLADRFQLKVHRETKEGNVFVLVAAKGGPKLKPSTAAESYIRLYRNTPMDQVGVDYTIGAQKASMSLFAERLGEMQLGRPVLDRTGLPGEFDFKLNYAINDDPDTGPSIFSAIQEQLGLKLDAAKGPIETLVIDHAEKPSAN